MPDWLPLPRESQSKEARAALSAALWAMAALFVAGGLAALVYLPLALGQWVEIKGGAHWIIAQSPLAFIGLPLCVIGLGPAD